MTDAVARRKTLAAKLREPMVNFHWNFGTILEKWMNLENPHQCGTKGCAIGYAALMWPTEFGLQEYVEKTKGVKCWDFYMRDEDMAEFFGMTKVDVEEIFYKANFYGVDENSVTPQMVADALDALGDEDYSDAP